MPRIRSPAPARQPWRWAPLALAAAIIFFDSLTDTGAFQGLANGSATLATGTRWTYDNAPFYADVLARARGGAAIINNPLEPGHLITGQ